jgi:hypothetical protein
MRGKEVSRTAVNLLVDLSIAERRRENDGIVSKVLKENNY